MAEKIVDHAAALVRTAHVRAAVIALLNSESGTAFTRPLIESKLKSKFEELGYDTHNFGLLLKRMASNNQIGCRVSGNLVEYTSISADVTPSAAADRAASKKVKLKPLVNVPADLKIDLIRETGKVRLTISGMVIEIGVV